MPRQRVLLVSYQFPPVGGIPVQRALSLARYLPELGWDVDVLTARYPSVPTPDESHLKLVPDSVHVTRTFTPDFPHAWKQALWRLAKGGSSGKPAAGRNDSGTGRKDGGGAGAILRSFGNRIFNPDSEVGWVPFAIRSARKIVRSRNIHAVLVTAPPFSSLLIGPRLKAEFPHLRLISDFRDEWLSFYVTAFGHIRTAAL